MAENQHELKLPEEWLKEISNNTCDTQFDIPSIRDLPELRARHRLLALQPELHAE
jgi:hypothetical protein